MSRAVELAEKHGLCEINDHGQAVTDYGDSTANIEAFYHAARAEMANEIIAEWMAPYKMGQGSFIERLRAMADREGK